VINELCESRNEKQNEPHKITRDMLPNLPDEIYEMFIVPQNDAPLNIFDTQPEGRWFYHFGGLDIEEFNKLGWRRAELSFDKDIFHPDTYGDIDGLIDHLKKGSTSSKISPHPADSRERVIWQRNIIKKTGSLFAPIVCILTTEGLKVLDGTHRIVAALSLSTDDSGTIPLDAWIGE
jgi:hypothetical protein